MHNFKTDRNDPQSYVCLVKRLEIKACKIT